MTAFRNQWLKVKQPPQTSTRTTVAAGLIQVTAHRSQMQPALLTHSPSLPHTHKYFSLSVPTLHKDKHNINRKTTHRLTTWAPPSCACWLWTNDISFNIKLSNKNEAFFLLSTSRSLHKRNHRAMSVWREQRNYYKRKFQNDWCRAKRRWRGNNHTDT